MTASNTSLTPQEIEHFRQQLLERKTNTVNRIEQLEAEKKERAPCFADPAERSFFQTQLRLNERLLEQELAKLDAIVDALARIDQGTYGICQQTGEQISRERLAACPESIVGGNRD